MVGGKGQPQMLQMHPACCPGRWGEGRGALEEETKRNSAPEVAVSGRTAAWMGAHSDGCVRSTYLAEKLWCFLMRSLTFLRGNWR